MLDEEAQEDLRANKNLNVYKGALYENIVGEALVKVDTLCFITSEKIPLWKRISLSELLSSCYQSR